MWNFQDKWARSKDICRTCGMIKALCICDKQVSMVTDVEFWLLMHPEELKRTSNTGRLIYNTINSTRLFTWDRVHEPKDLIHAIESNVYNIYLIMAADREAEKIRLATYIPSNKKTVFLILDGTWKEVRKMLRKSPYLDKLPILSFNAIIGSKYDLRRNTDDNHLCTVEAAIQLLQLAGENKQAKALQGYYDHFLKHFHQGQRT